MVSCVSKSGQADNYRIKVKNILIFIGNSESSYSGKGVIS